MLLFEIAIGAAEGGYQLGSAPDADGNMQSVWLNISEIKLVGRAVRVEFALA